MEKLCEPLGLRFSKADLEFLKRKAEADYRGNINECVRRLVEDARKAEKKEDG